MSIRFKLRTTSAILLLIFTVALGGQTSNNGTAAGGSLRLHFNNAQELQRAGKLNEAAEQYRAFLADALGELAIGYSNVQDYALAAPLFDEALTLEPNSPSLLLSYARTALVLGDLAHAKTLATEFIRRFPADRERLAQAHQVLGRILLKLNRTQEARKELETAVALDPTFPNGYDLAVACLDLDDEKCAVQIFGEMQKSFGDTPELHLAIARAYADSDFQPRAVPEFRRAIEENPHMPGAHYLLGAVLLATNDEQGGEAEFKKELLISPHDSMTYTALGRIAANRHNYSEAETYLKKAISFGPESPDAYLFLGQIYFTTNRHAEAETALRRCVELTTDVSRNRYQVQQAHFMLGRILTQKGQQDAARAEMKIAQDLANKTLAQDKSKLAGLMDTDGAEDIQAPPDVNATSSLAVKADPQALHKVESLREQIKLPVADSYNNLGAIAATNSDYSNAVKYFEHAFVWNPSLDGLDYNWGRAAFAGALFGDAVMPLSRYVGAHPDDAGARSVLGISQFMTGNYRGCIEVLEPVIGKTDLAPQVEYVYAESMIKTGRIATGAERLAALEKLHPEIPDVHRSLGEALAQQGDKSRALEELHTAIKLSPGDAESHYDLGRMQLDSGDTAAATPELEQAARLSPNNEKFHEGLARAYTAAHREADAQKEMEIYNMLHARTQSNTAPPRSVTPEQ